MSNFEDLAELVQSLLIVFIGKTSCICRALEESCEACHQRSRLEDYVVTYIATRRGRAMVQRSLANQAKKMDNLKLVELTEFLDDLADVYPQLDRKTTI